MIKMAQRLAAVLLLLAVPPGGSDRPPPGGAKRLGGGAGLGSGAAQTLMQHEVEPKGVRRPHEAHRLPRESFVEAEAEASRTETGIISGVFAWLEALYADLIGPPPVQEEGKPIVFPPKGIGKNVWFKDGWGGSWATSLWRQFDGDGNGYITKHELTSRWSKNAMRVEFGSPLYSPHIADYNGYLECMAYTVLTFRLWDVDKDGALIIEELENSAVWKKGLVKEESFNKWAALVSNQSTLYPDGFMALLWSSFAEDTPLTGATSLAEKPYPNGTAAGTIAGIDTPDGAADAAALPFVEPDITDKDTPLTWPVADDQSQSGAADEAPAVEAPAADAAASPSVITDEDFALDIGIWLDAIHSLVDSNKNKKIEASEWYSATLQGSWADVLWHKLDVDSNGQIGKMEFQSEMPKAMVAEFGGAPPNLGNDLNAYFSYVALSLLIFRSLDADMDGHLRWAEIQNGPLVRSTEKSGLPECGNFHVQYLGVMTQNGFNYIAGFDGEAASTLELEELVGLFAELFYRRL